MSRLAALASGVSVAPLGALGRACPFLPFSQLFSVDSLGPQFSPWVLRSARSLVDLLGPSTTRFGALGRHLLLDVAGVFALEEWSSVVSVLISVTTGMFPLETGLTHGDRGPR